MNRHYSKLDQLCINTIRFLAVDMVEKAKSGHPGAPLGLAPAAFVLWDHFLRHNPKDPLWLDRDRFVLSCGHASALLYAILHLTGYDLTLDELKQFRQWGSKTPGHPEYGLTTGVETTTGPLGQGFATAVGIALAERHLSARFNRPDHEIINHHTYVLMSDGDMMEGVASEAASFAGTHGLSKLIALYDSNDVSIEGPTDLTFQEDVGGRFRAYGWRVIGPLDGMNLMAVSGAINDALTESEKPTLIICKTVIGYGSPHQGTAKTHGEPLGIENTITAKKALNWQLDPPFFIPQDVKNYMVKAVARGQAAQRNWEKQFDNYRRTFPELTEQFQIQFVDDLPAGWDEHLDELFTAESAPLATRATSGKILNALEKRLPALMGGSADLAPSNQTQMKDRSDFSAQNPGGSNLHFGVREHAMGAIANGMALHGGLIPYIGTFLVFSDFMRPSIRLAALMGIRVIYIFTHDSIALGEDGPTHQPVEHLSALRTIPNLTVIRPADAVETAQAWRWALLNLQGPTAIVLTRQNVPRLERHNHSSKDDIACGGYIPWQNHRTEPEAILMGTGSEVHLALQAGKRLAEEGVKIRVVSLPSWELFDKQSEKYRQRVLPANVKVRVAIEAGIKQGWEKYIGADGEFVGLNDFGASAPGPVLYEKFGITAERVYQTAKKLLKKTGA